MKTLLISPILTVKALFLAAILAILLPQDFAFADENKDSEYTTTVFKVVRHANGWYRIMNTGALVALSVQESQALGLGYIETTGNVVTVVVKDFTDTISDIGQAGRYVTVDVLWPAGKKSYKYTSETVLPKAADMMSDAYWASKPVVEDAYDYTTQTIIPATKRIGGKIIDAGGDAIGLGFDAAKKGASNFAKWWSKE